jgi:integrase/recombinase XerD
VKECANSGTQTEPGHRATEIDSLMQYEIFCGAAESRSTKTVEMTILALKKLKNFLEANGLPVDAENVGTNEIRAFVLYLQGCCRYEHHRYTRRQEKRLSLQTVNCYYRALRAAWNRWVSDGIIGKSPFSRLKAPKFIKKVIPTFTETQIENLLNVIDTSTTGGYRDYTLFALLLDTACRLSEITNLRVADVDMSEKCLKVLGKGKRERIIPISATTMKLLWKYINTYRPEPPIPCNNHVFLTYDGRPLTKNRVENRMRKYGEKANIVGVRCSPHTLRHTASLFWIRNGGDIFSLQQITGHSSLDVLRGYVNLAQADVRKAHLRYSPLNNLQLKRSGGVEKNQLKRKSKY